MTFANSWSSELSTTDALSAEVRRYLRLYPRPNGRPAGVTTRRSNTHLNKRKASTDQPQVAQTMSGPPEVHSSLLRFRDYVSSTRLSTRFESDCEYACTMPPSR